MRGGEREREVVVASDMGARKLLAPAGTGTGTGAGAGAGAGVALLILSNDGKDF